MRALNERLREVMGRKLRREAEMSIKTLCELLEGDVNALNRLEEEFRALLDICIRELGRVSSEAGLVDRYTVAADLLTLLYAKWFLLALGHYEAAFVINLLLDASLGSEKAKRSLMSVLRRVGRNETGKG
ncbi:MAG: hypothetical protein DRJ69_07395 [Thermoprotei archaeon]|nr:MAG: hypothetical protein DRJ69_07395 [Thermoprotei archaeon]